MGQFWTDVILEPEAHRLLLTGGFLSEPGNRAATTDPLSGIEQADIAVVGSAFPGTAATFSRAQRLQAVIRVGIGYDNIDLAAASAAGVCAVNTPEAPTESTAEFTIALLLAVTRRVSLADRRMRAGHMNLAPELQGTDLAGKILGLVGCGRIGRRVAEIARAFRMSVQAFDPLLTSVPEGITLCPDLPALLATSDVVSLHVPLSPATRHLLNARTLALMKPGALLVNAARGGIVDAAALHEVLRTGRLAGAGIDVWDPEPPAPGHPLLQFDNVVASPHVAAYTTEGLARSHATAVQQALMVMRGEIPPALLNPAAWPPRAAGRKVC
jgi:phosphoglycerate dehydrogenase-like enzyme